MSSPGSLPFIDMTFIDILLLTYFIDILLLVYFYWYSFIDILLLIYFYWYTFIDILFIISIIFIYQVLANVNMYFLCLVNKASLFCGANFVLCWGFFGYII